MQLKLLISFSILILALLILLFLQFFFLSSSENSEATWTSRYTVHQSAWKDQPIAIVDRRRGCSQKVNWFLYILLPMLLLYKFFFIFLQVEINKWCFRVCVYCHLAALQKTPWVGCLRSLKSRTTHYFLLWFFVSVSFFFLPSHSVFYVIYFVYYALLWLLNDATQRWFWFETIAVTG